MTRETAVVPMTKALSLADIRIDGGTQSRVVISDAAVKEYAASIEDGSPATA